MSLLALARVSVAAAHAFVAAQGIDSIDERYIRRVLYKVRAAQRRTYRVVGTLALHCLVLAQAFARLAFFVATRSGL